MAVTNEEYENALAVIRQKDASIYRDTHAALDSVISPMQQAANNLTGILEGIPSSSGYRSAAASTLESVLGQINSFISSLTYLRDDANRNLTNLGPDETVAPQPAPETTNTDPNAPTV